MSGTSVLRQAQDERRTIRSAIGLALAISLAATPAHARRERGLRPVANPGAVIAAELGFASEAQEKGQWTAFRDTAAKDAEMFVPQRVNARDWLKGRANPPVAVKWQPQVVWSSCDGSYAVTRGAWQRPGSTGYFTTVWRRDKKGRLEWVLDQGDTLDKPLPDVDFAEGKVADCPKRGAELRGASPDGWPQDKDTGGRLAPLRAALPDTQVPAGADSKEGRSDDATLAWRSTVMPDMARRFTVWAWQDGGWKQVIDSHVAAPPEPRS
ncbi:MAG: hypothetical protein KGL48_06965 [Sphingomonadales bacterium]|nr:hypothetical protein [Sphingomonadales bacterium]MDE2569920.1 hypothetical protein [Sphingomonadales bacterium]